MIFAGLPAIIQLLGKDPCTTLPAPTTTLLPSVVPLSIILFMPMEQLSPITIGARPDQYALLKLNVDIVST